MDAFGQWSSLQKSIFRRTPSRPRIPARWSARTRSNSVTSCLPVARPRMSTPSANTARRGRSYFVERLRAYFPMADDPPESQRGQRFGYPRPGLLHTEHVPTQTESITRLLEIIAPARQRLVDHPLYREIRDIQHLRIFLQSHVFAVSDFMSLLQSLHAYLTCVVTPWLPRPYPKSRRLINEIVLVEESDKFGDGYISHFDLYLQAMVVTAADASAIRT